MRAKVRVVNSVMGMSFVLAAIVASANYARGERKFDVEVRQDNDVVAIADKNERIVIDISSDDGVGNATIKRVQGDWPKSVVVRMRLRKLEHFVVRWSGRRVLVEVDSGKTRQEAKRNDGDESQSITRDDPLWMSIQPVKLSSPNAFNELSAGIAFEVTLPAQLSEDQPTQLKLGWIESFDE